MQTKKTDSANSTTHKVYTLEFEESLAISEKAIDLAEAYLTPPMPKVYEVLYTYAGGKNPLINHHIDMIIDAHGGLNIYDVNEVYNEYFSVSEKSRRQNDRSSEQLKSELDIIIDLINTHSYSNEKYAASLKGVSNTLNINLTQQQVKNTIEMLILDNQRMQSETSEMAKSLEKSKAQMQKINEELAIARQAIMQDPVTNLGNRRWLEAKLDDAISKAKITREKFCIAFVDIDHFKQVNDQFGHAAGDQVLRFLGSLLTKSINGKSMCARYGGEEFVIIFPETSILEAKKCVEKIKKELETSKLVFSVSKKPIGIVTASFGVVQSRSDDDVESIIIRADQQMYKAKEAGRNCIVCSD